MRTEKIGRNDPCPCGSGEKYKHCCLRKDRRHRRPARARPVQAKSQGGLASVLTQLRRMTRRVGRRGQTEQMQELDQLMGLAEEMAAYEAMSDEIAAAAETLEEHRAEFEAMVGKDREVVDRTWRLFSEERFAHWRFTAEDVYRAFEVVGYPPQGRIEAEENAEVTVAAILHLADGKQRMRLARQLVMLLPEYVDAGRYLDAWLIQYSAYLMIDKPRQSSPFLFMMFYHGYEEWATQIEDQQDKIVREMGFDPDEIRASGSSMEELEARVRAELADPEKKARLEALYAQHGMMAAQVEAEALEWKRNAMLLLEREDAARLYPSEEEMAPWVPALVERLAPMTAQAERALAEGRTEDPASTDAVSKEVVEIAREIAAAVFTPERVAQLVEELRAYRRDLEAAQERQAAISAQGAIVWLEEAPSPEEVPVLIGICFASLRSLLVGFSEEARAEPE